MPGRFVRDRSRDADDEEASLGMDDAGRNGVKLDRIKDDVGDMRVAMTSLAGDVKSMVQRIERHDGDHVQQDVERVTVVADVERRIRALERRSYAIPGLGAVLGVLGLAVALWAAFAGR